jgi:hypothetical protein
MDLIGLSVWIGSIWFMIRSDERLFGHTNELLDSMKDKFLE